MAEYDPNFKPVKQYSIVGQDVDKPKPFYIKSYMNGDDFAVIIAFEAMCQGGTRMISEKYI